MERYICIHGHFYQPPRENPWLEAIEIQDSAHPYHDWNQKITAECYATNATSRILDEKGRIIEMVNNYAKMSFNFGPTLLSWLEEKTPDVYNAILEADRKSQEVFSGHGAALAQGYSHMILPLANTRDKHTQVLWGIRDFEHRFHRKPEGMWLPETAVDLETLDILADHGIRFTILAPHQAARFRSSGTDTWQDVTGGRIDPTTAYTIHLPSGKSLALFFYDGPTSRAVAFERLLRNGELFAQRLLQLFSDQRPWPQLVHIATDGETYGHHHRFGDMALAYALHHIESRNVARITNYGEYLEQHPPTHEVEIIENTSWSCSHGIERWRSDCGCSSGAHPGWNQSWRQPLRAALDWLRERLADACVKKSRSVLGDFWEARNDYIHVVLDRSDEATASFLEQHTHRKLSESERITAIKLLEIQRHAMLMYTSCGWFFDELSGIETVQAIQYAGRALQLGQEIFRDTIQPGFVQRLARAKSNIPEYRDGQRVFEKFVEPAVVDLQKVCAHYALSSLFHDYPESMSIYSYRADQEDYRSWDAGRAQLVVGRVRMASNITKESRLLCFGVLHLGDHNLNCGVRAYRGEAIYQALVREISEPFERVDFPETILLLDKHFGSSTYALTSLFGDEQRMILNLILDTTLQEAEAIYRQIYEHHVPLMRFLKDSGMPRPRPLYLAAELVLNSGLRRAFEGEELDFETIRGLLEEAEGEGITLDANTLEFSLRKSLERIADRLQADASDSVLLANLAVLLTFVASLPFEVNLWRVQNVCYDLFLRVFPEYKEKAHAGDEGAGEWMKDFQAVAERLSIGVE